MWGDDQWLMHVINMYCIIMVVEFHGFVVLLLFVERHNDYVVSFWGISF